MHSSSWVNLIQRIPMEHHNILFVVTSGGVEISVQCVLRMEQDFVVIHGRLAGTTDNGRIFFIPYEQVDFIGIQKELKASQFDAMYGGITILPGTDKAAALAAAKQQEESVASETSSGTSVMPAVSVSTADPIPEPPKTDPKLSLPRKSGLLQRLRARAQSHNGTRPAPQP